MLLLINWNYHFEHICTIAVRCLYHVRILKGIPSKRLLVNIYLLLVSSILNMRLLFWCDESA